ncbi:hypothetical protein NDU88_009101 [Pleurodeles waltl]|uniref:Uncharacterized protein n=1 Tax=Pleurodeles waltl TaxID=8319 RepID=A0AAV7RZJ2_PLEWA|nr:hypothetical protein NDU88_009101 [Pleurodeles waltl]
MDLRAGALISYPIAATHSRRALGTPKACLRQACLRPSAHDWDRGPVIMLRPRQFQLLVRERLRQGGTGNRKKEEPAAAPIEANESL